MQLYCTVHAIMDNILCQEITSGNKKRREFGCGQKDGASGGGDTMRKTGTSSPSDTEAMAARNVESLKGGGSGNLSEALPVETLKKLLPFSLVGMDRETSLRTL